MRHIQTKLCLSPSIQTMNPKINLVRPFTSLLLPIVIACSVQAQPGPQVTSPEVSAAGNNSQMLTPSLSLSRWLMVSAAWRLK